MASRRTFILFGVAAATYLLGFVLCIVGYSIPWLQPRATYRSGIQSVGLVKACFSDFKFPIYIDRDQALLDDCYRVSDPKFDRIKEFVNPDWFERIRHMHFASILILSLNILLIMGYVAVYIVAKRQIRKRDRPTTGIIYARAACGLWFVPAAIVAILEIVEPSILHVNYERNANTFYPISQTDATPLYYSGGFAVTIVSSIMLVASTVCGVLLLIGICFKATRVLGENYMEKKIGGSVRGSMRELDAGAFAELTTIAPNRRLDEPRLDTDGEDLIDKFTRRSPLPASDANGGGDVVSRSSATPYRSEPRAYTPSRPVTASGPAPASRTSIDERDRSSLASYTPSTTATQQSAAASGRPVPAPRRSLSSRSQEALHKVPPSDEGDSGGGRELSRAAARASAYELRSNRDRAAAGGLGRSSPPPGDDGGAESVDPRRRRYSAGSSYRPPPPATDAGGPAAAAAAAATNAVRPPSFGSGTPRQPPIPQHSGARRPDDLPLRSQQGSLPRSTVSGGSGGGGSSYPSSLASADISIAASAHYDSNPASGYKPKELAMMRFISDRTQAMNVAVAARASMEQRRSSSGAGRPADRGSVHQPKSPSGPKSPAVAVSSPPQQQQQPATPASGKQKSNAMYVSY